MVRYTWFLLCNCFQTSNLEAIKQPVRIQYKNILNAQYFSGTILGAISSSTAEKEADHTPNLTLPWVGRSRKRKKEKNTETERQTDEETERQRQK